MKAIRVHEFGDPDVLRLEEVPDPTPGEGQVLVRLRAAGVNPVDAYIRTGTYAMRPNLPYTPGSDGAGEVAALGPGVSRVNVGDRVYTAGANSGTYAEQVVAPESGVFPLPERLSFEQGAAVGVPWATAYRALHQKGRGQPGEWLLVHGASGGVGTALVQLARAHGLRVIGTAGTEEGRRLVRELGAEHALDHGNPRHLEQARELTGGHGVDLIVEFLANVNLAGDLQALARGGRVVVVGNRGTIEINPRDAMARDASIHGMVLFNASPEEIQRIHAGLGAGFAVGAFAPVVGQRFPLAQAAAAQRYVLESRAQGKVVLVP